MKNKTIDTVIFDIGGVLIDWNPEYLFRKIFAEEEEMKFFLSEICSPAWNDLQDAGRPLEEATEWLVDRHPEYEKEIRNYYGRWEEMLGGAVDETVTILRELHAQNTHRLYALTNWSHETFPVARARFDFLGLFEDILVSGEVKLKKPDLKIYRMLLDRFVINPAGALFIDDSTRNIAAAETAGLATVHFQSPEQLRRILVEEGILTNGQ